MRFSADEVRRMLEDPDPSVRLEAALDCYDGVDPALLEALTSALSREDDVKVRATLLKAVSFVGDKSSIPLLLKYFDDPDDRVRANAVEAVARYGSLDTLKHLKKMFNDPHDRVRGNAILAMAVFAPTEFRRSLERMCRSTLPSTCSTALYILSKLEEPWAVSLLGRMALRPDNPVRSRTFKVLDMLARRNVPGAFPALYTARRSAVIKVDPKSLTVLQPPKVTVRNLAELLSAPDPRVRIFAVQEGAQRLEPERVLPALCSRLEAEVDERVVATLVKWIGIVAKGAGLELVEPFLTHADGRVRANTLEGLSAFHSKDVYRKAVAMSDDPVPRVRAVAARIIAGHDPYEAFRILKRLIFSDDEAETAAALHVIDVLEGRHAVELLEHALLYGGEKIRSKVLSVLKLVEKKVPMVRGLRRRFEDGSFARYEQSYIDEQTARLDSSDDAVRLDALNRLRFCRSTRAWDTIEELAVNDRSMKVRELASRFVGACNVERRRRVHYHSFGLRVKQLYELGMIWEDCLRELCEKVIALDGILQKEDDASVPVEQTLMERRDTLILLGERGWEVFRAGRIRDEILSGIDRVLDALGEDVDA